MNTEARKVKVLRRLLPTFSARRDFERELVRYLHDDRGLGLQAIRAVFRFQRGGKAYVRYLLIEANDRSTSARVQQN